MKKNTHIEIQYRCFKKFNEQEFRADLLHAPFHEVEMESDIDTAVEKWYNIFTTIIDKHAPTKIKRVKSYKQAEWFNQDINEAIHKRDMYHSIKDWENYKIWRNKTTSLINLAKSNYYKNAINENKHSKEL